MEDKKKNVNEELEPFSPEEIAKIIEAIKLYGDPDHQPHIHGMCWGLSRKRRMQRTSEDKET